MTAVHDHLRAFWQTMRDHDLAPEDSPLNDGLLHRFHVVGDKPGSLNGWYCFFADGVPAGSFGSWKLGIKQVWCAKPGKQITPAEELEIKRRTAEARQRRDHVCKQKYAAAAVRAKRIWASSPAASPQHPYLQAKQVQPYNLRQSGLSLLVPLWYRGELVNVQFIAPNGTKKFLAGGRVKGAVTVLGSPDHAAQFYIVEGWASGASVFEEYGEAVFAAMNCHNLKLAALEVRTRFRNHKITIIADNDRHTAGNPGVTCAKDAARIINADLEIPKFPESVPGTDINDLINWGKENGRQID